MAKKSYPLFKRLVEQELGVKLENEYRFHPIRRWKFDFAIPEKSIAIEVEGGVYSSGRHTRGSGFRKDTEKYNTATAMGWRVLRFATNDLMKSQTLDLIKQTYEG